MSHNYPAKVLITGGHEIGGVSSFADGLQAGFAKLGIPVEIVLPSRVFLRWRELRDRHVLKILSTAAVYAAPFARHSLCVAHGFPRVAYKGWPMALVLLASYQLANACPGTQLVAVSDYSALVLRDIFGLHVDAVIHNPVLPPFMEAMPEGKLKREAITYVGRLHRSKNVDRLLPAMRDVLDENRDLCAWIIGDGPHRQELEQINAGDKRIQFLGLLASDQVRERLRQTRVFVSGNPTEPFGITYLEALSQGCHVAMPASGGGLEIAPNLIGSGIQLFPSSVERHEVAAALRKALAASSNAPDLAAYSVRAIAEAYLTLAATAKGGKNEWLN
jgi:glycosyltransferase involved in cell wall biosynthesis